MFKPLLGYAVILNLVLMLVLSSCRQIPATPEALCEKIARQMVKADPLGTGIFYDSRLELDDDHLIIIYQVARQDTPDDPWRRKREVRFLFRPAIDPEAPGGWYLERVGGEYVEFLGVGKGLQFQWKYAYFQTANGPREGIVGVDGIHQIEL